MKLDSQGRRARQVVLLVIAMIALPSVALTALAIAAIENEEAAARKRLEVAYLPVLSAMAKRFNDRLDAIVDDTPPALHALLEWSEYAADVSDLAPLDTFRQQTPFATNYFVIDDDGNVLFPRNHGASCEAPWSRVATQHVEACEGGACDCTALADLGAHPDLYGQNHCAARYAAALCRAEQDGALAPVPSCLEGSKLAEASIALSSRWLKHPDDQMRANAALQLATKMSAPQAEVGDIVGQVNMWWFVPRLRRLDRPDSDSAIGLLQAMGSRAPFLDAMATLSKNRDGPPMVWSWSVEGLRRVVVLQSVEGYLTGYELTPEGFQDYVAQGLAELDLETRTRVHLLPIEAPRNAYRAYMERYKDQVASWSLLAKTQLAWELVILLDDEGVFFDLLHQRATLYMWGLGLVVLALLGGIGYTVRAVLAEARESRLKTDFVSSVSHDLRTPLTSIRMFTESLLMGRVDGEEDIRESLTVIASETERLSRLTERILDFSRMEAGRKAYVFEPTSVAAVVTHAMNACAPMIASSDFEVTVDVEPGLPDVLGDKDALIEALINLITNAVKYSVDDRSITVEAKHENGEVVLAVSDRGMGISRADQRRIFEKFYRVDCRRTSEVGGCGLGLSLVRHIVEAHDGMLSVVSTLGEGSTFTIRLAKFERRPLVELVGEKSWNQSSS